MSKVTFKDTIFSSFWYLLATVLLLKWPDLLIVQIAGGLMATAIVALSFWFGYMLVQTMRGKRLVNYVEWPLYLICLQSLFVGLFAGALGVSISPIATVVVGLAYLTGTTLILVSNYRIQKASL